MEINTFIYILRLRHFATGPENKKGYIKIGMYPKNGVDIAYRNAKVPSNASRVFLCNTAAPADNAIEGNGPHLGTDGHRAEATVLLRMGRHIGGIGQKLPVRTFWESP